MTMINEKTGKRQDPRTGTGRRIIINVNADKLTAPDPTEWLPVVHKNIARILLDADSDLKRKKRELVDAGRLKPALDLEEGYRAGRGSRIGWIKKLARS